MPMQKLADISSFESLEPTSKSVGVQNRLFFIGQNEENALFWQGKPLNSQLKSIWEKMTNNLEKDKQVSSDLKQNLSEIRARLEASLIYVKALQERMLYP